MLRAPPSLPIDRRQLRRRDAGSAPQGDKLSATQEQGTKLVQQREAVVAHRRVFGHDQHAVEERIDRRPQPGQAFERPRRSARRPSAA